MKPEIEALLLERDSLGWERYGRPMCACGTCPTCESDETNPVLELLQELLDGGPYAEKCRLTKRLPPHIAKRIQQVLLGCIEIILPYL